MQEESTLDQIRSIIDAVDTMNTARIVLLSPLEQLYEQNNLDSGVLTDIIETLREASDSAQTLFDVFDKAEFLLELASIQKNKSIDNKALGVFFEACKKALTNCQSERENVSRVESAKTLRMPRR
jgi:hypothetical protein